MAQASHENYGAENYIRTLKALQYVLSKSIPCLQNAIDTWHIKASQKLQPCTVPRPNFCQTSKKPSTKSCQVCINWVQEIENQLYQAVPGKTRALQWSNADPSLFGKDPLEVIKLFALRLPTNPISSLEDFDHASLLMIMANFKDFHNGDKAVYEQVMKVSHIRNCLAHLKVEKNLSLDDKIFNTYWTDITDFVKAILSLGRRYFTQATAQDIHERLIEIKTDTVMLKHQQCQAESLRPMIENVIQKTLDDKIQFQGDPLDVASCQKLLRSRYRQKRFGIGFLPGVPKDFHSDEFFVELTLAKEQKTPTEVKYIPLKTYTDLLCIKDSRGKPLYHVLVAGLAGTGKTTLVSRLAYQWATVSEQSDIDLEDSAENMNVLTRFELVFALDIRKFEPDADLVQAIRDQLLSHVPTQVLHGYLLANADRCLFLFDGYDELSSPENVINSDTLSLSNVIITSRPDKVDKINRNHPGYVHVSLNGFSESSVYKFVHKFFGDSVNDRTSTTLIYLIESMYSYTNRTLISLSQYPLLLTMICLIYKDQHKLPETISSLFESIIKYLVRHWKARRSDCIEMPLDQFKTKFKLDDLIVKLGITAFKGLNNHDLKLIFKNEDFESQEVVQVGCEFGVLSQTSMIKGIEWKTEVSFIHKTFQEYCAAMYLCSLGNSARDLFESLIQHLGVNDEGLLNVLKFCCGSSVENARLILPCTVSICKKQAESDKTNLYTTGMHQWLPIILLYEVEIRFGFNEFLHSALKPIVSCFHGYPHYVNDIENVLAFYTTSGNERGWLSMVNKLCLDVLYFRRKDAFYAKMISKLTCLAVVYITNQHKELSYVEIDSESLHSLLIRLKQHPSSSQIDFVCDINVNIRKPLKETERKFLVEICTHKKWHLRRLCLNSLEFTQFLSQSHYLQMISELHYLVSLNMKNTSLIDMITNAGKMQQNKDTQAEVKRIDVAGSMPKDISSRNYKGDKQQVQLPLEELAICACINTLSKLPDALKFLGSLKRLFLSGSDDLNSVQNNHIERLGSAISRLKNLQSLGLVEFPIGSSIRAILHGVSHTKLNLLNLSELSMTEESKDALFGMHHVSHDTCLHPEPSVSHDVPSLRNMHHLKVLILERNNLSFCHVTALSDILKNMSELTQLNLSGNKIGSDGLQVICESFEYTPNLSKLELSGNHIGSDGAVGLANSFEYIKKISHIDLTSNPLGPKGIEAMFMNIHHLTDLDRLVLDNLPKTEIKPDSTLDIILKRLESFKMDYFKHNESYHMSLLHEDFKRLGAIVQEQKK